MTLPGSAHRMQGLPESIGHGSWPATLLLPAGSQARARSQAARAVEEAGDLGGEVLGLARQRGGRAENLARGRPVSSAAPATPAMLLVTSPVPAAA